MEIPADIIERLKVLGLKPSQFVDMVGSQGADFVRGYVERLEDADSLYRQWAPKLRSLASEWRRANPCPQVESLSARDHAKLEIYEAKIQTAERLPRRERKEVVVCCAPLLGILAAQRLWPGDDDRSVFLTPDERSRWRDIYKHSDESFWWFTNYWWNIEDPPKPGGIWTRGNGLTVPDDCDPWLVTSGLIWGSLAGREDTELWSWDGVEAKFVEGVGCLTF